MFRSADMCYCELFLQPEAAFSVVSRLGELGCCEFRDMKPDCGPYERHYLSEVCRLYSIETKLRILHAEMHKDDIYSIYPEEEPKALELQEISMYENIIEKWENEIAEISLNQFNLLRDLLELREMAYILTYIGPLLGDLDGLSGSSAAAAAGDIGTGGKLFVVAGVVNRLKAFSFELMLWRVSRGNIYYRQASNDASLTDPYSGQEIRKVAFLIISQGEMLSVGIQKVLTGFRVNIYPCSQNSNQRNEMFKKVQTRLDSLEEVLQKSHYFRCKALRTVGKQWRVWMMRIRKAKSIYHTMNLFSLDVTKNCLIGQCWIPQHQLKLVQDTLDECTDKTDTSVPSFITKIRTIETPPTYQRVNKFTAGFQAVIDAYGDSKYKEVNAGQFTVVTFPFLFAIMFGDMGHAFIMLAFALWMIIKEKQFMKERGSEIWNIMFGGRYVMLLLGLFSVFTGFVYNDIFSKAFQLSDSMWKNVKYKKVLEQNKYIDFDGTFRLGKPYLYGKDPIWALSSNQIIVQNSLKMKFSIIIGVVHMLFGIVLSACNHVYFKQYHCLILEFIPKFFFLFCIFFWLVLLIYYKWFFYYDQHPDPVYGSACAPQILILFIDMILMSTTAIKVFDGCETYLFNNQQEIQSGLLFFSLACVPVLLLGTPIYVHYKNRHGRPPPLGQTKFRSYQDPEEPENKHDRRIIEIEEEDSFSDLMIHSGVETIEFVLSTISHTASYLRLWALSLAHAQLSEMLWDMILSKLALRDFTLGVGTVKIFIIFAIWATFTVCILVVMEGLSAFLHTLRLHWVEFMSKFFEGGGTPFRPYSFKALLATEMDRPEGGCKLLAAGRRTAEESEKADTGK